uniref:Uncharacterized protein n=1 Tax=Anguilla anguilla TaxID=7936 RepID=A0A0E9S0Q0_ANGAN
MHKLPLQLKRRGAKKLRLCDRNDLIRQTYRQTNDLNA